MGDVLTLVPKATIATPAPAKPKATPSFDVIARLRAVLARAERGDVAAVLILTLDGAGNFGESRSEFPSAHSLLGKLAVMQAEMAAYVVAVTP